TTTITIRWPPARASTGGRSTSRTTCCARSPRSASSGISTECPTTCSTTRPRRCPTWHSPRVRFPPANIQLRRAQLVLVLATLVPTILMTGVGVLLLLVGQRSVIAGVLVLTFCTSLITGYILVSIFVGKGASLARVQNDFVSSVSHELRTPVTSIRLLIESLADGRLADTDRV